MMERLTEKNGNGYIQLLLDGEIVHIKDNDTLIIAKKLKEYEDFEEIFREKMTDTACEFLRDKEEFGKWLERNKWIAKKCDEYARAEEQGLLLQLPCKVGDTIYEVSYENREFVIKKHIVKEFIYRTYRFPRIEIYCENENGFLVCNNIGKLDECLFLTQEEAEQKLKEMEQTYE